MDRHTDTLTDANRFLANLNPARYMSSSVRQSSVCSRLSRVHATQALKFSTMFLRHLVRWPSADIQVKFYGDRPRGTPASGS